VRKIVIKKKSVDSLDDSKSVHPLISQVVLLIGVGVAVYVATIIVRQTLHDRRLGQASLNWPQTEGVVTRCEYHVGTRHSSYAIISYEYLVDGIPYYSEQTTIASHFILRNAKAFVSSHPTGAKIPVYYDRSNPRTSVLIPGIEDDNAFKLAAFGGSAGLLVLTWAVSLILKIRKVMIKKRLHVFGMRPDYKS
jgi:hypothetical protein